MRAFHFNQDFTAQHAATFDLMQSHAKIQSNLRSLMSHYKYVQQTANSGFTSQEESYI